MTYLIVIGIAGALWLVSWAVDTLAEGIHQALTELEPDVEDVTERRRLHAIVEWKR